MKKTIMIIEKKKLLENRKIYKEITLKPKGNFWEISIQLKEIAEKVKMSLLEGENISLYSRHIKRIIIRYYE